MKYGLVLSALGRLAVDEVIVEEGGVELLVHRNQPVVGLLARLFGAVDVRLGGRSRRDRRQAQESQNEDQRECAETQGSHCGDRIPTSRRSAIQTSELSQIDSGGPDELRRPGREA